MTSKIEELIGNLIRDVTKVGFMPKSEARRRMLEIYTLGREEETIRSAAEESGLEMQITALKADLLTAKRQGRAEGFAKFAETMISNPAGLLADRTDEADAIRQQGIKIGIEKAVEKIEHEIPILTGHTQWEAIKSSLTSDERGKE